MRSILSLCTILVMAFAITGCGPSEELVKLKADTEAAYAAAQASQAETYAPEAYRVASAAIDSAAKKFEEKKFFFFNKFDEAEPLYVEAQELANSAKSEADTNRQLEADTQAIIERVTPGISETRVSLGEAPRGKGADDDLDQLNADLNQAESNISDARGSLDNGQYRDALAQAQDAETKLTEVQGAVTVALQKIEDWKERHKPWYFRL